MHRSTDVRMTTSQCKHKIRLIETRRCSSKWKPMIHWIAWLTLFFMSAKPNLIITPSICKIYINISSNCLEVKAGRRLHMSVYRLLLVSVYNCRKWALNPYNQSCWAAVSANRMTQARRFTQTRQARHAL